MFKSLNSAWPVWAVASAVFFLACGESSTTMPGTDAAEVVDSTVGDSAVGCNDDNPCTDDFLKADGSCAHLPLTGQACDDANACTAGDQCNADGVCVGSNAVGCDDGNPCTLDGCDATSGCTHEQVADGTTCDDGNNCTLEDSCQSGLCKSASMVECEDSDPFDCTYPVCNKLTGDCDKGELHPAGHPCSDGDACTDNDQCDAKGACKAGEPHNCVSQHPCKTAWCNADAQEGANPCVLDWKADGVGCDDGDACTTDDKCADKGDGTLKCTGTPLNCDDGSPCTSDSCDEADGCHHVTLSDGMPCSVVGDECATDGKCEDGVCVGTLATACNDENPCTDDSCDSNTGDCIFVPNDNDCDDGSLCTSDDVCTAGDCAGDTVVCPADTGPCLLDVCNPDTGLCDLPVEDGLSCADGDLCNGAETCVAGACLAGDVVDCSNLDNPCLEPDCNGQTGACDIPVVDGTVCADDDLCNGAEACLAGECVAGEAVDCSGVTDPCLAKQCNPVSGACDLAVEDGVACDDGDACTAGDSCQTGNCVSGPQVVCDDDNECTVDACDASEGCQAQALADGQGCDAGLGECLSGQCLALALACGGVECPELEGYHGYCNAKDHCEYERKEIVEDWHQWDVWIYVPPGTFQMGSPVEEAGHEADEEDVHAVTFAEGFFIQKHEVVVAHYEACMADNPTQCTEPSTETFDGYGWGLNTSAGGRADHPQNGLMWQQAASFCNWAAPGGRLPSEAEWEYAATGPAHMKYPWGDGPEPTCSNNVAMYNEVGGVGGVGCGTGGTSPAGEKSAGASWCGALDMGGNLCEWNQDWWHDSYQDAPDDGSAWLEPAGVLRTIRGGGFVHYANEMRSSNRSFFGPTNKDAYIGARCVRPKNCLPSCDGKQCGDDGCGGSCGECGGGHKCDGSGMCIPADMVLVLAGPFWMGCNGAVDGACADDEFDQHEVTLPDFLVDVDELTRGEYMACVNEGICDVPDTHEGEGGSSWCTYFHSDELPINCVDWHDAEQYCTWAGKRLCSEAEWEKAARGGCDFYPGEPCKEAMPTYPWGNAEATCEYASMQEEPVPNVGAHYCCDSPGGLPLAVGSKPKGSSPYGVRDMGGNLLEWVADSYHETFVGSPADGTPWIDPENPKRVKKGGDCWSFSGSDVRCSARTGHDEELAQYHTGIRCCKDLACLPECTGLSCGNDGCGGTCGECGNGENCIEGTCLPAAMVKVPAGSFGMGCAPEDMQCNDNEKPFHEIFLDAYLVDKTEVTVEAYSECVSDAGACTTASTYDAKCTVDEGDGSLPVNCVNWTQAAAFCAWENKRLCTEAEWEKAARGTDARIFPWGDTIASCAYAVMDDGGDGCGTGVPWPVGSKPQGESPYGVHDMAGNLYEWVSDYYSPTYYGVSPEVNPKGPQEGNGRTIRGGSYVHPASAQRVSFRHDDQGAGVAESYFNTGLGFRCCRDACWPDCQ